MSHQNQHNRVESTPDSIIGDTTTMSQPQSPTHPESISELELAVRLGLCIRAMLNRRTAGTLPPHFLARAPYGHKPQVRYLLADVAAWEQAKPKKTPTRNEKTDN